MTRPDDIVALIDGGFQSSHEHGYGTTGEADECIRCFATVTTGAVCDPCRAWLSGESDTDPAERKRVIESDMGAVVAQLGRECEYHRRRRAEIEETMNRVVTITGLTAYQVEHISRFFHQQGDNT